MIKPVNPIWRLGGSKFKLLKKWLPEWNLNSGNKFIDLFGGSLIVGVNVKHLTGATVFINDYDNIKNKTLKDVIVNQTTYGGLGKNFTTSAIKQFNTKLLNGFLNTYKLFKKTLSLCHVWKYTWPKDFKKIDLLMEKLTEKDLVYIDPPYINKYVGYPTLSLDDHKKIANWCNKWSKKTRIMISYNGDSKEILNMYKDWNIVFFNKTNWFCKSKKSKTKEIIIKNYI